MGQVTRQRQQHIQGLEEKIKFFKKINLTFNQIFIYLSVFSSQLQQRLKWQSYPQINTTCEVTYEECARKCPKTNFVALSPSYYKRLSLKEDIFRMLQHMLSSRNEKKKYFLPPHLNLHELDFKRTFRKPGHVHLKFTGCIRQVSE